VAYNTPGGAVKIPVSIPPAAGDRQRILLKGKGPAQAGGQPGDVIVTVSVSPDPLFTRRGYDIVTQLELSPQDLNNGCRPLVTSLTGKPLRLTIPPATIAGATFKVPAYGLPKPDGTIGDMLVKIKPR
jgi:molecular chaperone DnaJ